MKDLSKEERLEQEILEMAEEYGNKKWLRVKRTFFILSGVVYLIVFMLDGMNNIQDYLGWLISAPTIAGFIMFISLGVWSYVLDKTVNERIEIAKLECTLNAIKFIKYNDCEDEKTKEIKTYLKSLYNLLEIVIDDYRNLEDFDNEVGENEETKNKLEYLKGSLKLLDNEYKFLKLNKVFDNEVEENEED